MCVCICMCMRINMSVCVGICFCIWGAEGGLIQVGQGPTELRMYLYLYLYLRCRGRIHLQVGRPGRAASVCLYLCLNLFCI